MSKKLQDTLPVIWYAFLVVVYYGDTAFQTIVVTPKLFPAKGRNFRQLVNLGLATPADADVIGSNNAALFAVLTQPGWGEGYSFPYRVPFDNAEGLLPRSSKGVTYLGKGATVGAALKAAYDVEYVDPYTGETLDPRTFAVRTIDRSDLPGLVKKAGKLGLTPWMES